MKMFKKLIRMGILGILLVVIIDVCAITPFLVGAGFISRCNPLAPSCAIHGTPAWWFAIETYMIAALVLYGALHLISNLSNKPFPLLWPKETRDDEEAV